MGFVVFGVLGFIYSVVVLFKVVPLRTENRYLKSNTIGYCIIVIMLSVIMVVMSYQDMQFDREREKLKSKYEASY